MAERLYLYVPTPEDVFNVPTVGTPIDVPVAGGQEWFSSGVIVSTERGPLGTVAIEIELAEGVSNGQAAPIEQVPDQGSGGESGAAVTRMATAGPEAIGGLEHITPQEPARHLHCDGDLIECSHDASLGQVEEARRVLERLHKSSWLGQREERLIQALGLLQSTRFKGVR